MNSVGVDALQNALHAENDALIAETENPMTALTRTRPRRVVMFFGRGSCDVTIGIPRQRGPRRRLRGANRELNDMVLWGMGRSGWVRVIGGATLLRSGATWACVRGWRCVEKFA